VGNILAEKSQALEAKVLNFDIGEAYDWYQAFSGGDINIKVSFKVTKVADK